MLVRGAKWAVRFLVRGTRFPHLTCGAMCGRFTLTRSAAEVAEHFGLTAAPAHEPRFNVAPSQLVLIVRKAPADQQQLAPIVRKTPADPQRECVPVQWGLVPFWAKHAKDAARHINARSETLPERPAFREAAERRRCLVPADGFYEWRGGRNERAPFHIALPGGELFAFAGLWERWLRPDDGGVLESVSIVTTAATPNIQPLHARMPIVVDPAGYDAWLAADARDVKAVLASLPISRGAALVARAVSVRVNDVRNDDAACLAAAEQGALF